MLLPRERASPRRAGLIFRSLPLPLYLTKKTAIATLQICCTARGQSSPRKPSYMSGFRSRSNTKPPSPSPSTFPSPPGPAAPCNLASCSSRAAVSSAAVVAAPCISACGGMRAAVVESLRPVRSKHPRESDTSVICEVDRRFSHRDEPVTRIGKRGRRKRTCSDLFRLAEVTVQQPFAPKL